jgi:hypothetical protein
MLISSICAILEDVPKSLCTIICDYGQLYDSPQCPRQIVGPETCCVYCDSTYFCCAECFPKCNICGKKLCKKQCISRGVPRLTECENFSQRCKDIDNDLNHAIGSWQRELLWKSFKLGFARGYGKECNDCHEFICFECVEQRSFDCFVCQKFFCTFCRVNHRITADDNPRRCVTSQSSCLGDVPAKQYLVLQCISHERHSWER